MLTVGQVHDSVMLKSALSLLNITESMILADKAYGFTENRQYISDRGEEYCIPPRKNTMNPRNCDYHHYNERHWVECFFMKQQMHS